MYYVTKREKCLRCNGVGVTNHPAWEAYWRKWPQGAPTKAHEYASFAVWGHNIIPPEEIVCNDCDGAGVFESEATLSEALRDMGLGQLVQLPEVIK